MNRPTKALLGFAVLSLAVYGGLCALLYSKQRTMLYYPQFSAPGGKGKTVLLRTTGPRVLVSLREHAGPDAIVYFGGNAELVSQNLPAFSAAFPQHALYLLHYRGYGGSEGAPSEATITADALRWYDYAVKQLGAQQVIAFGRSLGSGVAVRMAAERRVDGVVLVAPYDSMTAVARHHYPLLPVGLLLKHRFDSISLAPKITAPLLCIAATYDEVIPIDHARRLYEAWAGPKRWLEIGTRHNGTDDHPEYWPAIEAFLAAQ